jgi:hypothetical protein
VVLLETYAHLIEEFADAERIDAEAEIASVCQHQMFDQGSLKDGVGPERVGGQKKESPALAGLSPEYRYRDSNPGFRRERAPDGLTASRKIISLQAKRETLTTARAAR